MDGQFEPLRGNLAKLGILLNTASNDEHVPEIERQIRTVKEGHGEFIVPYLPENATTTSHRNGICC